MTDEFTDLENELKRLRPRSLPAPLVGRIAQDISAEAPAKRGFLAQWRTWILPAAAAAMLAVTVTSIPFIVREREVEKPGTAAVAATTDAAGNTSAARESAEKMRPVRATNVLYDAVNEGVVRLDDNSLAQRMRLNYLDTITWENPNGGALLQRTVPREEILFIPVTAN